MTRDRQIKLHLAVLFTAAITLAACGSGGGGGGGADASSGAAPMTALDSEAATKTMYLDADEVWVVERADETPRGRTHGLLSDGSVAEGRPLLVVPGQGELRLIRREGSEPETEIVPVPLEHTDVKARVSGFVASVAVTQTFKNPYDKKIEAVYVFPLPTDAAVSDFLLIIGERKIRGLIREKEEAEKIYREAKAMGHVAALLTQQRPNVFDQKVANIEPGKKIDVRITYFNTVPFDDGAYEFAFPMVVGPRFQPPTTPKSGEASADRHLRHPKYLRPHQRSGHDIAVTLDIDAGIPVTAVTSPSHSVRATALEGGRYRVTLGPNDRIPNRDFVVRWTTRAEEIEGALLTHAADGEGGTFALMLQPPKDDSNLPRMPREMVFVVDTSGSMEGEPLDKVKDAMRRCLRGLDEDDTFQIIRFSDDTSTLGDTPVRATKSNVRRGLRYIDRLDAGGGTMMSKGITAALSFPQDERRLRIVSFMTDGYIGNEQEIFRLVEKHRGRARIFGFGVGSSVNRYLLEGLARHGRGAVAFVGLSDSAVDAVDGFYRRASRPALTDLRLDVEGATIEDVYPRQLPDLYPGRPVLVTGRIRGSGDVRIRLTGRRGTGEASWTLETKVEPNAKRPELGQIWARRKIAHLSELEVTDPSSELRAEITRVSLKHSVQCRYTAFLAVDTLRKTEGDEGVTVPVPVPVPDGVKYETTVGPEGK